MTSYEQSLEWLYSQLPMYQRVGSTAFKKDLTNTLKLLDFLGNPHLNLKCIHVAGTNGKGTTCHMLASILKSAGYKTGLYTSPHLKQFTERMRINDSEISEGDVVEFVELIKPKAEVIKPSFFEMTVAMAFWYFHKKKVDIAVIETGLGGRLDSTNVVNPMLSIITRIGYDHMDLLGDTLEEIAGEKAGIIKKNTPAILSAAQPQLEDVFKEKAEKEAAPLIKAWPLFSYELIDFQPTHQVVHISRGGKSCLHHAVIGNGANYVLDNLPGTIAAIEELKRQGLNIPEKAIREGLNDFQIKGRWQVLRKMPVTIADISHNELGLKSLLKQIQSLNYKNLFFVLGFVKDKEIKKLLKLFPKTATYFFTQSIVPRALPLLDLEAYSKMEGLKGETVKNVNDGLSKAYKVASKDDLIVVCGSTFVVAEIDNL